MRLVAREPLNATRTREVVEFSSSLANLIRTAADIERFPTVIRARISSSDSGQLLAVVDVRGCHACRIVDDAGVVVTGADTDAKGNLILRVVAPGVSRLRDLVRMMGANACRCTVALGGRQGPPGGATPHQLEVLRAALEQGYFDGPKRVRISELAADLHLSESVASRLLRKAIRNQLRLLIPSWNHRR
jgi:predicted DNA binding protein